MLNTHDRYLLGKPGQGIETESVVDMALTGGEIKLSSAQLDFRQGLMCSVATFGSDPDPGYFF